MNPLIFVSREKYILRTIPFMVNVFYLNVDFFPF